MADIDERLHREFDMLQQAPASPAVFERVAKKRTRRHWVVRIEAGALAIAVIAGTATGIYGLSRAFRSGRTSQPASESTAQSNGQIVLTVSHNSHFGALALANPDGQVTTYLTKGPSVYADPAWSPDGSQIAYLQIDRSQQLFVGVMNADGSGAHIIRDLHATNETATLATYGGPDWSPDGSQIAFVDEALLSQRGSDHKAWHPEIFVMNADGTGARKLTGFPWATEPAWSPDGTQIAFSGQLAMGPNSEVALMSVDGTPIRKLAKGESPTWSPDGSQLAFATDFPGSPGAYSNLRIVNADGTGLRDLLVRAEGDSDPQWSPDGRQILFTTNFDYRQPLRIESVSLPTPVTGSDVYIVENRPGENVFQADWQAVKG